jgi:hypothetical protein
MRNPFLTFWIPAFAGMTAHQSTFDRAIEYTHKYYTPNINKIFNPFTDMEGLKISLL